MACALCRFCSSGARHTCYFSLLWREGDEEVNRAEERIHSIAGNNWLICGLSIQQEKRKELVSDS